MSGVEELVTALAAHYPHGYACGDHCPHVVNSAGGWAAHVAEQLQPLIRQAQAEALREAADNMPLRRPGQPYELAAGWLRARADYRVGGS